MSVAVERAVLFHNFEWQRQKQFLLKLRLQEKFNKKEIVSRQTYNIKQSDSLNRNSEDSEFGPIFRGVPKHSFYVNISGSW